LKGLRVSFFYHCQNEMAGFQSLPVELLQEIVSLVSGSSPFSPVLGLGRSDAKALCEMRCISQLINAVVEPMLYKHLVLQIDRKSSKCDSPLRAQLGDLADGSTTAATHAKTLTVRFSSRIGEVIDYPYLRELSLALEVLHNIDSVM
jgi:hypothetical protein